MSFEVRVSGSFADIYRLARDIHLGKVECDIPEPEVRFTGSEWRIESGLTRAVAMKLSTRMEVFDMYFGECYGDPDYEPTDGDGVAFCSWIGGMIAVETMSATKGLI